MVCWQSHTFQQLQVLSHTSVIGPEPGLLSEVEGSLKTDYLIPLLEGEKKTSFAFTASENALSRNQQLAITAIANQFAMDMFDAQVDADSQKAMGALVGNMLQSVFNGVIGQTGIFSSDDDADDFGGFGSEGFGGDYDYSVTNY